MSGSAQLSWARLILRALVAAGVRHAVFSPGSRSTPLVLAAQGVRDLGLEVLHDERSAGFFALGQARASGRPSLLVCTSGSAAAHYYPAVIEARAAGVPLIVLSANRPPELQQREASQTIDQRDLFGAHAKRFVDLGPVDLDPEALRGLVATLAHVVHEARAGRPGPIHLDVGFRKPFEPSSAESDDLPGAAELLSRMPRIEDAEPRCSDGGLGRLVAALERAERPLAILGPAGLDQLAEAPRIIEALERLRLPYAAEPGSQIRFAGAGAHAIGPAEGLLDGADAPDLVVQIGRPPTSAALERVLARRPDLRLVALSAVGFPNPTNRASQLLLGAPADALERAADTSAPRAPGPWSRRAGTLAARQLEASAALSSDPGQPLDDLSAVRVALDAMPLDAQLVLGNSLPVRVADLVAPARGQALARVLTQRGAAGIDGLAAGAAGAAGVAACPTLLAYGDVSFAHDLGGLLVAARARTPLVLLVLDNGGGRIFEELPVREWLAGSETFERFFLTPTGVDILALARSCGLAAEEAHDVGSLRALLDAALERAGATIVVARIAEGATRRAFEAFTSSLALP